MAVTLSVKNVPAPVAKALRERAARNHRSLQGELLSVLSEAVAMGPRRAPMDIVADIRARGIKTGADSVAMIRTDRGRS